MSISPRANRGPAVAAENRAAIIKAAGEIFAEQGLDAPLNAIAKRAGVGQGSLYRNFPTRQSLAFVAFENNLAEIEAVVARGGTLADVLTMVSEQASSSVAFIELIARHPDDPQGASLSTTIAAIIDSTLEQGRAAGTIPPHFTTADVMLAILLVAGGASIALAKDRASVIAQGWRMLAIQLG